MSRETAIKVFVSSCVCAILVALVEFVGDYLITIHGLNRAWQWAFGGFIAVVVIAWTIWLANHQAKKDMQARGWTLEEIGDDYEKQEREAQTPV